MLKVTYDSIYVDVSSSLFLMQYLYSLILLTQNIHSVDTVYPFMLLSLQQYPVLLWDGCTE